MHHSTLGALSLLMQLASSDPRQFLEKCFAQSVEETPSNQPLLLIVLMILAIAITTAYRQAVTHTAKELLWMNSQ